MLVVSLLALLLVLSMMEPELSSSLGMSSGASDLGLDQFFWLALLQSMFIFSSKPSFLLVCASLLSL